MSIYLNRMLASFSSLGIVNTAVNSSLYAETSAVSQQLEALKEQLEELFEEAFITTACSYGLSTIERELGQTGENLTTQQRRQKLIDRKKLHMHCLSPSKLSDVYSALGTTCIISEDAQNNTIELTATDQLTDSQKADVMDLAEKIFPVGDTIEVDFL